MATRVRRQPKRTDILTPDQLRTAARTFSVLADLTRLRIIHELIGGESAVGTLADAVDISHSATSHQLSKLRDLGLVRTRRNGSTVFYELANEHVANFFREALYHSDHIVSTLK